MGFIEETLAEVVFPKVVKVKQTFNNEIADLSPESIGELIKNCKGFQKIKPGMTIAIASGSRGLHGYAEITKVICDLVKEKGASPFIFPAMGSHGGATAEGQKAMLEQMNNISEETMGVPIKSTMEVVKVGEIADGREVNIDKNACEADGIIIINRVKAHTSFKGKWESGLMKMMAIGLGKQHGAEIYHRTGFCDMPKIVDVVGHEVLKLNKILFGVASIENGYNIVKKVEVINAPDIPQKEAELLKESYETLPVNFWKQCDVLIVKEIGKDISGAGMDPNLTGRFNNEYFGNDIKISKIGILDITEKAHGNAAGVGLGDFIAKRLYDKIEFESMYANALTNTVSKVAKLPIILKDDVQVVKAAIKTSNVLHFQDIRFCYIKNTKDIDYIYVTENMVQEAIDKGCEVVSEPMELQFNENNDLILEF